MKVKAEQYNQDFDVTPQKNIFDHNFLMYETKVYLLRKHTQIL